MRSAWKWVSIGLLVVLALGFAAEAGGNGALKLTLYRGVYDDVNFDPPRYLVDGEQMWS